MTTRGIQHSEETLSRHIVAELGLHQLGYETSSFDFVNTFKDLSSKRKNYIGKSIKLYQKNLDLDEESRLKSLEQKLSNDLKKFQHAKLSYKKKEEELQDFKKEFNAFWIKLKESIQEFSQFEK